MLDFIIEKTTSWEYLRDCEKPVFIYGMGNGALKIMKAFKEYGITVSGFFASGEFYRGHMFEGHFVHTLTQIEEYLDDFVIVLAFAAGYKELYDRIITLSKRYILLAPDVPVAGEGLFTYEYCLKNAAKIDRVYSLLEDETSRRIFANVINFKISGKIKYLDDCVTPDSDIYSQIIKLSENEIYVDLGAYNGDTVIEFFAASKGKFKSIYAFEPNPKNYKRMKENIGTDINNIHLINAAAWSETGLKRITEEQGRMSRVSSDSGETVICHAVDEAVPDNATLIKLDVEGAERDAILGARRHIENGSKIICALYHRNEDIFDIPLLLYEMNPNLRFFIRRKLYIPAWETNLYCL